MKYIYLLCCLFSLCMTSCDNSDEIPPRIEDIIADDIIIPTYRLTYEERDIISTEKSAYEKAVADRISEK